MGYEVKERLGKLVFNKETQGYRYLKEEENDMVREEMVEVPKGLVNLVHSMAKKIQRSHSGWWESYCSSDEKALVGFSIKLKKPNIKRRK